MDHFDRLPRLAIVNPLDFDFLPKLLSHIDFRAQRSRFHSVLKVIDNRVINIKSKSFLTYLLFALQRLLIDSKHSLLFQRMVLSHVVFTLGVGLSYRLLP